MAEMKAVATLIGDVVGSREALDRADLHDRLVGALAAVNEEFAPVVPLRVTVGDEYQGSFRSVGAALQAALRLRLLVLPEFDLRHGIGWGATTVLSEDPRVEDGPGWWAAREAIGSVAGARGLKTAYQRAQEADPEADPETSRGPDPAAVNAALVSRDALLAAASPRSWGVLRGLLGGMSQREIAAAEGVSASAVSQRVRRDHLTALVRTDDLLGDIR